MEKFGGKNIHFVGIGGIGMSGIAGVLLEMGCRVSGSDVEPNPITRRIESLGGNVFYAHSRSNIPGDTGFIVRSSAISKNNPELKEARDRKIEIVHRAEMLGAIFNKKKGIAVTGTHGKTTTTSLISVILAKAGMDPTVIIGGEVDEFGGNARMGAGAYMVAEADESDGSFLHLKPLYAVLTNLEMEHVDHYRTIDDAKEAYGAFLGNVRPDGAVFYNSDDKNLPQMMKACRRKSRAFGFSKAASIRPVNLRMDGFCTSFECVRDGKGMGMVHLGIPGRHNVLNALAAIEVGLSIGVKFEDITKAAADFKGAKRRFQLRADIDGVMLIDDYAHHPTEIRAVIEACRNWPDRRVRVVFQPHRYTRTKFLAKDFGACFSGSRDLILTDIYAASERPLKGVSIRTIYDAVRKNGMENVRIIKKDLIADRVMEDKRPGDIVLVLGAGDIKNVADAITERMRMEEIERAVKGRLILSEPLLRRTSFRIGGPADAWVEPADINDLKAVLKFSRDRRIPVFVMGNGSNVLARDEGFRGIVIRLSSPAFRGLSIKANRVRAGAGLGTGRLVRACCEKALAGIESLVGIPGTVGGAVYMNAGGWNSPIFRNIGSFVESLKVMAPDGSVKSMGRRELKFGYRASGVAPHIILEVDLKLGRGERRALMQSSSQFLRMKKEKQVLDTPSAGCVFKNPSAAQFSCAQMIDMLGLKGRSAGGAEISKRHANFIVNRGGATYNDVMALVDLVKRKVKESYGVELELEIKVL